MSMTSPGATSGNGGWSTTVPSAWVSVSDTVLEKIRMRLRPAGGLARGGPQEGRAQQGDGGDEEG